MATDKKFLITYDSVDRIYRFFSEDKARYQLALSAFGVRELEPIILEAEDNFYIREITDTNLKTVVLDVSVPEPDEGVEPVVIELEDIKDYIIDYSVDNSFVMIDEEVVLNALSVEGGRAKITLVAPIPESVRVQLSYYSAVPLEKDVSYNLTINGEELSIPCQIKNEDIYYLGDWNYFMGDDSPEKPSSETIIIEASEHSKDISDAVNTVITYSDNGKQYKITFGEKQEGETFTPIEYILSAKELVMSETSTDSAAYVGNLSLYRSDGEDTKEPFFIITKDFWLAYIANEKLVEEEIYYHIINENLVNTPTKTNLPLYYRKWYIENEELVSVDYYISCVEDTEIVSGQNYYTLITSGPEEPSTENDNYMVADTLTYKTWLYVEKLTEPQEREYSLLIEDFNLIIIPELAGAALVSFGRKETENGETVLKDNYGIGINSSDNGLTLPERAISLFETELDNSNNKNKIKFNYRGILGTLPSPNSIGLTESSIYNNNMVGTQGIFTDNMYIGDKNQYVAFYTDSETKEKQLSIKANNITIKGGQSIFNIGDSIDTLNTVVNPTGWIADHGEYAKTEDTEIVDGKLYYRRATNLIEYPFHHTTRTENGITFTDNGDGTVTANGTATANTGFGFRARNTEHLRLQDIDYTFTGCPEGGADDTYYVLLDYGTGTEYGRDYGSGVTFAGVPNQDTGIWIQICEGAEISNLTFEARLKNASEAEYTLVTPISNPKDEGLYELASVDRGVSNYIATHLALTKEGLYVQTDKDGIYKALLKSNGLFILKNDTPVSVFSENPQIGTSEYQHLDLSPNILRFMYQGKTYARFGVDNAINGIYYDAWTLVSDYGPVQNYQKQVHTLKSAYYVDNQEEIPLEKIEITNTTSPYGFIVNLLVSEEDFRPYRITYDAIGPIDYYDLGLNSRKRPSEFGLHSVCIGYDNIASGENSIAIGRNNKVQRRSLAFGDSLITDSPYSIALGKYNESKGSNDGLYQYNSPLLYVGMGKDNNRRNSFELNYNGQSTRYIYSGSGSDIGYKIVNVDYETPGGFFRIEDETTDKKVSFGMNYLLNTGIWIDGKSMIYHAHTTGGVYIKNEDVRIDDSWNPGFSWTSTIGTLANVYIQQYGKIVQLTIRAQNKAAVEAGGNYFDGIFSPASIRPKYAVTSGSYYGRWAFNATFGSSGELIIRNANHEKFTTITYGTPNALTMSFTYIVE